MSSFKEIAPDDFLISPFRLIGRDWMLIAAEKNDRVNAMTASWGGLGVMWSKNVAFIVIRPQRLTKAFVDAGDVFSLNFFGQDFRKELAYFGSVSGRDEDKIAKTNLDIEHIDGAPYFPRAANVLVCRKLFAQPYLEESFIDKGCAEEWYPEKDFHTLYVGEVLRILGKDN